MAIDQISLEGLSADEINNLAALSVKAMSDPKTKRDFQRVIKQLNPSYSAPELDVDDAVARVKEEFTGKFADYEKQLTERTKKLEDLENGIREKELRSGYEKLKRAPIDAGLIAESDLPDLQKMMKEEGFAETQYMQAAKYFKAQRELAPPSPAPLTAFKLPNQGELRKNPKQFFRDQTLAAVNDSRARKQTGTFGNAS